MLIEAGSEELYDPDDPSLAFTYTDARGQTQTDHLVTLKIVDRALFEQGLASLREAAGKPRIESHAAELADRRLAALPGPSSLADEVIRIQFARDLRLPFLNPYRDAVTRAGRFAAELASKGNRQRVDPILADERNLTRLAAAGAKLDEEVLVAEQMLTSELLRKMTASSDGCSIVILRRSIKNCSNILPKETFSPRFCRALSRFVAPESTGGIGIGSASVRTL
jgi:hypothetical protein